MYWFVEQEQRKPFVTTISLGSIISTDVKINECMKKDLWAQALGKSLGLSTQQS